MRLRKDIRENLKESDYWQNVTKPSLINFLKYRETKVHEKLDRNNEILQYKQDLKKIETHYKYGSNAKIAKVAKLKIKDELISSEVNDFWRSQEIQNEIEIEHQNDNLDKDELISSEVNDFRRTLEVEIEQQTDESDNDELISSEANDFRRTQEVQSEIEIEQQIDDLDKIKIYGILKKEILIERNIKSIINAFELYKDNNVYQSFLESLNQYDKLIPDETYKFLVDFFSQKLTYKQWSKAIDNLNIKEHREETTRMIIKMITKSLDNLYVSFALEHMNPLHNIEALEQPHLNDYIHPCIKSALWSCTEIYYTSGEISSINHINRQKGDVKARKELDDRIKIIKNLENMLLNIVKDRVKKRKLIIPDMEVFGVISIELNLHLYALSFT
ncbi:17830_t:CDS:10, partial [Funneliformis caledonium]